MKYPIFELDKNDAISTCNFTDHLRTDNVNGGSEPIGFDHAG